MDPIPNKQHNIRRLPALVATLFLGSMTLVTLPTAQAGNCWDYADYNGYCTLNCDSGAGLSISVGSQNEGNVGGQGSCPGATARCDGYAQCHGQSATLSTGGFGSCSGHADNGDITLGCASDSGTVPGGEAAMILVRSMVSAGADCIEVARIAVAQEFHWMAFVSSSHEAKGFLWTKDGGCPATVSLPPLDGGRGGPWTCRPIGKANSCYLGAGLSSNWLNPT